MFIYKQSIKLNKTQLIIYSVDQQNPWLCVTLCSHFVLDADSTVGDYYFLRTLIYHVGSDLDDGMLNFKPMPNATLGKTF